MINKAYDISNFTGFLSADRASKFAAAAQRMVVRCGSNAATWNGDVWIYTRQQLLALHEAGVPDLQTYVYLNFQRNAREQIEAAINVCRDFSITCFWLDCEAVEDWDKPANSTAAVEFIKQAVQACTDLGIPFGIYTGSWWWIPRTGDYKGFSHIPLWVMSNDKVPDVSIRGPFGGWRAPTMEQFEVDIPAVPVRFDGVPVDISAYVAPDPTPPVPILLHVIGPNGGLTPLNNAPTVWDGKALSRSGYIVTEEMVGWNLATVAEFAESSK